MSKIREAAERIMTILREGGLTQNLVEQAIRETFSNGLEDVLPCRATLGYCCIGTEHRPDLQTKHDKDCPAYYRSAVAALIEQARAEAQQEIEAEMRELLSTERRVGASARIADLERQIEQARAESQTRFDHLYNDSMIAHRWFAERFGEEFNGRDFAVKCSMADDVLEQARAEGRREALEKVISCFYEFKETLPPLDEQTEYSAGARYAMISIKNKLDRALAAEKGEEK